MSIQQPGVLQYLISGIAGSIGAIMSIFILHPIDNVKLRMQIDTSNNKKTKLTEKIKTVYKEEGIFGFYKGISSTIAGNFISNFVYFIIYNYLKNLLEIQRGDNLKYIFAVFISGIATSVATNPFWVIQTTQTNHRKHMSVWETAKYLGPKNLFKGLSASFILVFNPIINYLVYENMKFYIQDLTPNSYYQPLIFFFSGAMGKFLATLFTYPYQLLRTKSHLQKENFSYMSTTKSILKSQGILGLYSGLQAKLYQTVLNSAFALMFYEEVKVGIENLLEHLDETRMVFGLKIVIIFFICFYIQSSRKVKHIFLCEIFLGGFFLTLIGNLVYLIDMNEYKSVSLGFFAMGLLFYIHSTLYNFSNEGNRMNALYLIVGVFAVVVLVFTKIIEYVESDVNFGSILGFSLVTSLFIISLLRYGKTSKKSYCFSILGALSLAMSVRLMYIEAQHEELSQEGKYFICFIQLLSQVLLVVGTISHAKYDSKKYMKMVRKQSYEQKKKINGDTPKSSNKSNGEYKQNGVNGNHHEKGENNNSKMKRTNVIDGIHSRKKNI